MLHRKLIIVCLLTLAWTSSRAWATDWLARLKAEGPQEWSHLEHVIGHSQGSYVETNTHYLDPGGNVLAKPKQAKTRIQYFIDTDQNGSKFICSNVPDDEKQEIYCSCKDYYFYIKRSSDKPPVIFRYDRNPRPPFYFSYGYNLLTAEHYAIGRKMSDLLAGHAVERLTGTSPLEAQNGSLLRVDFDSGEKPPTSANSQPGWAVVDPKLFWAVVSSEYLGFDGYYRQHIEYQETQQDIAFPGRVTTDWFAPDGTRRSSFTLDFDRPQPCSAGPNDFTLKAYGLEQPAEAIGP